VEAPAGLAPDLGGGDLFGRARGGARQALGFIRRDPALLVASSVLLLLVLLALIGPVAWRKNPLGIDVGASLQAPSWSHPMGTDSIGRDVFARFLEGARISLAVGGLVVLVGALIGGFAGILAGVSGGWIDAVLMRIMDAILAFPPLILAMAVSLGLGAGLDTAGLGIMLTTIPYYARLLRSEVLRIRALPFVEAAHALGARRSRIMLRHIVPHVVSTLLIQAAAVFGYAILTLAALGFVGLGARVPTPEWGAMITDGLQYFLTGQWWIGVFPGLGVLVAVTAASVIADRVRDILDPRGRYAHV
jgi:peptide/nickel transport system permease protein